jgi:hypothetical protein
VSRAARGCDREGTDTAVAAADAGPWLVTAADYRRLRAAGALVGDRVEGVPVGVLRAGARLTVDAAARRPRPAAWTYELWDGVPRIEPKAATVPVHLALAPRVAPAVATPAGVVLVGGAKRVGLPDRRGPSGVG